MQEPPKLIFTLGSSFSLNVCGNVYHEYSFILCEECVSCDGHTPISPEVNIG